jgi:hypothetical protein
VTKLPLRYVNEYRDVRGKLRRYFRRPGHKRIPLPGLPGSDEFMAAYQAAVAGVAAPLGRGLIQIHSITTETRASAAI